MLKLHRPLPFGAIDLDWSDSPVFVIGGGTSLEGFPFEALAGKGRTLGANRSAFVAGADALYTLDQTFARRSQAEIGQFVQRGGVAVLAMPANEDRQPALPGVTYVIRDRGNGLSKNPRRTYGTNSGYGALNVAFLAGAREIHLLGFDMTPGKAQSHFHGGYPWHSRQSHKYLGKWASAFDWALRDLDQAGVRVTNWIGSPASRITAFPTRPLSELAEGRV